MRLLTRNTGRDDNNVGTVEGLLQAIVCGEVASDFLNCMSEVRPTCACWITYSRAGDVRKIGSNTRGVDDIVKGKLVHERTGFEEE